MMHRGIAGIRHQLEAIHQAPLQPRFAQRWDCAAVKCDAAITHGAGRLAIGITKYFSTYGVGRSGDNSRRVHGKLITPSAKAVGTVHKHGIIRHGCGEAVVAWVAVCPQSVVPAPCDYPLPRGNLISLYMSDNAGHSLSFICNAFEIYIIKRRAKLFYVRVGVREAGKNCRPTGID